MQAAYSRAEMQPLEHVYGDCWSPSGRKQVHRLSQAKGSWTLLSSWAGWVQANPSSRLIWHPTLTSSNTTSGA